MLYGDHKYSYKFIMKYCTYVNSFCHGDCVLENLRLYWTNLSHPESVLVEIMHRNGSLNCLIISVVFPDYYTDDLN
jgi:hypothetical protein